MNTPKIVIVDYGMGNIGSIRSMLSKCGFNSVISSSSEVIAEADKLILPGVGHFERGMASLHHLNLISALNDAVVKRKIPVLGICLGMQLMGLSSEEGNARGLGWVDADFVKFDVSKSNYQIKIPHMAWNWIKPAKSTPISEGLDNASRFYFVHSYHAVMSHPEDVLFTTEYGYEFCSAFEKDNVIGVQFHPEKSHRFGMQLLRNFVELY